MARIKSVMGTTLLLATPDGPRTVELDDRTQVKDPQDERLSLQDLKAGQPVAIFGHRNSQGQTLVVDTIVLLPRKQAP